MIFRVCKSFLYLFRIYEYVCGIVTQSLFVLFDDLKCNCRTTECFEREANSVYVCVWVLLKFFRCFVLLYRSQRASTELWKMRMRRLRNATIETAGINVKCVMNCELTEKRYATFMVCSVYKATISFQDKVGYYKFIDVYECVLFVGLLFIF